MIKIDSNQFPKQLIKISATQQNQTKRQELLKSKSPPNQPARQNTYVRIDKEKINYNLNMLRKIQQQGLIENQPQRITPKRFKYSQYQQFMSSINHQEVQIPSKLSQCSQNVLHLNNESSQFQHNTQMEGKQEASEIKPANNTIKLRKSYSQFQSNKQLQIQIGNKVSRVSSQYQTPSTNHLPQGELKLNRSQEKGRKAQSEEKIKVVDIFQEKNYYKEEQKLRTIIKTEHQPSMVEKNLQKYSTHQRNTPMNVDLTELNPVKSRHQQNISNYFSQDKSLIGGLPSRQRDFSSKTPQKCSFIKSHFNGSNNTQEKLNESKDILLQLQSKKVYGQQYSINTNGSGESISRVKRTNNTNQINTNQISQSIQQNELDLSPQLTNLKEFGQKQHYFSDSPKLVKEKKITPLMRNLDIRLNDEYFMKKQPHCEIAPLIQNFPGTRKVLDYQDSSPLLQGNKNVEIKPQRQQIKTDRILDLLLLSTGELKTFFQRDKDKNQHHSQEKPSLSQQKRVKYVQNNQIFPVDFFSVLRQT